MIRRLLTWLKQLLCRHAELEVPPRPARDHPPSGNLLAGGGCSTDDVKRDFFWSLAMFKGFRDGGGDPMFGGLRTPAEAWVPIVCLRCEKLAFARAEARP